MTAVTGRALARERQLPTFSTTSTHFAQRLGAAVIELLLVTAVRTSVGPVRGVRSRSARTHHRDGSARDSKLSGDGVQRLIGQSTKTQPLPPTASARHFIRAPRTRNYTRRRHPKRDV